VCIRHVRVCMQHTMLYLLCVCVCSLRVCIFFACVHVRCVYVRKICCNILCVRVMMCVRAYATYDIT